MVGTVRQSCHKFIGKCTAQQVLDHRLWFAPSGAGITGGLINLAACRQGTVCYAAVLPDKYNIILIRTYLNIQRTGIASVRCWTRNEHRFFAVPALAAIHRVRKKYLLTWTVIPGNINMLCAI